MYKTVEVFPNMKSFLKANRERKLNKVFQKASENGRQLQDINSNADDFQCSSRGTKNYKEAESLALKGWNPSNSKSTGIFRTNGKCSKVVRRTMTGPVGYAPHVPNAIAGRPDSMIYQKRIVEPQPMINIFVNISVDCHVSREQMQAATINLFTALKDTKINLCVGCAALTMKNSREIMEKLLLVIKLKDETLMQKFFAVAHPSMLRRLFIRWADTVPGLKSKKFIGGYGASTNFTSEELKELGLQDYKVCNVKDFIGLDKEEILAKLRKL